MSRTRYSDAPKTEADRLDRIAKAAVLVVHMWRHPSSPDMTDVIEFLEHELEPLPVVKMEKRPQQEAKEIPRQS